MKEHGIFNSNTGLRNLQSKMIFSLPEHGSQPQESEEEIGKRKAKAKE
jgi:hypothetical protein